MAYKMYDNPPFQTLLECVQSAPLMFGNTLALIYYDKYLVGNKLSLDDKQIEALDYAFSNMSPSVNIIFVCRISRDEYKKPDSRKKLYKVLSKHSQVREFAQYKGYDKKFPSVIIELAKEKGLTIMKFEEFLIKYQSSRYFRLLLEIKDSKELGVKAVDMAEEIIAKYADWDERIMIISFSTDVVNHVLANYKDRHVAGMGYNMVTFLIGSVLNLDCLFNIKYHSVQSSMITKAGPISIDCATQSFVDSVHARNQCVAFWTINEEADMRYLVSLGVDVITTNSPDVLAKVLGKI
jgi:glycerophosphoryl diester phosphodiesterase